MKRLLTWSLLTALLVTVVLPADAARRVVVRRGPHRTVVRRTVVVHRGWPIRRPLRAVVVHPARVALRVTPAVFLAPVLWTGVAVAGRPAADVLVWEDAENLTSDEDWTESTLDCNRRGSKLWLEVESGRTQFDWAEVTFANGEAVVVDMKEWTRGPGLYSLYDFRDGRVVDHVRVVGRAKSEESRVALRMET